MARLAAWSANRSSAPRVRGFWQCGAVCLILWALVAQVDSTTRPQRDPHEQIQRWLEEGRYADADAGASQLLGGLKVSLGATAGATVDALDLVVEARLRNGRGTERETRDLAQQSLVSRDSTSGHPRLADSLRNLADVFFELAEYQLAIERYQLAMALRSTATASGRLDTADDLRHLARALMWADRTKESLAALNRAQAIQESELGSDAPVLAETLEVRALLLQRTGNYGLARPVLERAVSLRRKIEVQHPVTAAVLSLLGLQLWLEGDLVKSKQACDEALSIATSTLRPEHPEMALVLEKPRHTGGGPRRLVRCQNTSHARPRHCRRGFGPRSSCCGCAAERPCGQFHAGG